MVLYATFYVQLLFYTEMRANKIFDELFFDGEFFLIGI